MKRLIPLVLIAALLMAAPAHAGEDREVALGVVYGAAFGFTAGGIALIFSPDPDHDYPAYLLIGTSAGFLAGLVYGIFVPPEEPAAARAATFSFDTDDNRFALDPLGLIPRSLWDPLATRMSWETSLLRIDF